MKKLLSILLVLTMVLGLASVATAETKPLKIGVCIYKYDDNFMTLYRTELEKYLTDMGHEVTVVDGKNDQAEQTNQINSFIADKVDVLIVNLVQSSAAATVIDLVKAAGIPTVFINREPTAEDMQLWDKIAYVGADARQSGTFQGEIIAATENKGDYNGNGTVDYVMIVGDPENVDAQYRTEFSIKALEDAGLKLDHYLEDLSQSLGEALLTPTRIYVHSVLTLLEETEVRGMAHITGGGLAENLKRIMPAGLLPDIVTDALEPHPIFDIIARLGDVASQEMLRTFNMGIGFVLVVAPEKVTEILMRLRMVGQEPLVIGQVGFDDQCLR